MAKETWMLVNFSKDLPHPTELYNKLKECGNSCILSTSMQDYADSSDRDLFYNPDPILAFQNVLNSVDESKTYKVVILGHGKILNGAHHIQTEETTNSYCIINTASLLNLICAKFRISEILVFSCHGGAVHKDLDPTPTKIYTLANPESPYSSSLTIFHKDDKISSIKDIIISMSKSNIINLFTEDSVLKEEFEQAGIEPSSNNVGGHTPPRIMFSENGATVAYETESLHNGLSLSATIKLVPEELELERAFQNFVLHKILPKEIDPEESDLFFMLKTHYCLLTESTVPIVVSICDLNDCHSINIGYDRALCVLIFSAENKFFNFFKDFKVSRSEIEDYKAFSECDIVVAMSFIPQHEGEYRFEICFVQMQANRSVMLSQNVSQSFKDKFFSDIVFLDLMGDGNPALAELSYNEALVIGALEASRDMMKILNEASKQSFTSPLEACYYSIFRAWSLLSSYPHLDADQPDSEITSFICLKPDNVRDMYHNSDIWKIDIQEEVFNHLSGLAAEWVEGLTV